MKTMKLNGRDVPIDDSRATVAYVEVVTEAGIADGVVYLGLGQLIGSEKSEDSTILGAVHLRMSVNTARKVAGILSSNADKSERQQAEEVNARLGAKN